MSSRFKTLTHLWDAVRQDKPIEASVPVGGVLLRSLDICRVRFDVQIDLDSIKKQLAEIHQLSMDEKNNELSIKLKSLNSSVQPVIDALSLLENPQESIARLGLTPETEIVFKNAQAAGLMKEGVIGELAELTSKYTDVAARARLEQS